MVSGMKKDGFEILTYLKGEKTSELPCQDREEAEQILYHLTSLESIGMIHVSDTAEKEVKKLNYDIAEMRQNGKLVAMGLNPRL